MEPITDATTFANDLYSAHKEHAGAETHNLPTILRHHHGHTWQQTADATRIHHHLESFDRARRSLPEEAAEARRWARGLAECMAGNLACFGTSHRYATRSPDHSSQTA